LAKKGVSHFWNRIDWQRKGDMGGQGDQRGLNKYIPEQRVASNVRKDRRRITSR
jgi:hypothetical protein